MKTNDLKDAINFVNKRAKETLKTNWQDALEETKNGQVRPTYKNCVILFENSEEMRKHSLMLNDFTRRIEWDGKPFTTATRSILRNTFESVAGFRNKDVIDDFVNQYSYDKRYNPVIDYLDSIRDKRRPDIKCKDVFVKWFKAEETPHKIVEAMTEKWFVSGIKRIYEPGCPIEGMIYVFGKTGTGKSTFIDRLSKGFSSQYIGDLENISRLVETMNTCWILNFDEMKSLVSKPANVVKEFLTTQSDTVRLAYRTDSEEYNRHCIYFGSTNNPDVLKDYSGDIERRFWPIISLLEDKKFIFENFNDDEIDAIWADALWIYEHNKNYNITTSDFNDVQIEEMKNLQRQCKTYYNDDCVDLIREILNRKYWLNSNKEFDSLEDFKNQVSNPKPSAKDDINYIPISYINVVLQVFYHQSRKNNWIAAALSEDWVFKKKFTKTYGHCMCLIRKEYDTDLL